MGNLEAGKIVGGVVALLLLIWASVAIWRWGARYKTNQAKVAAVLMLVGLWWGVARPGALIIFLVGTVMMVVARKKASQVVDMHGMKKCQNCAAYVPNETAICSHCGNKFPKEVGGIVLEE